MAFAIDPVQSDFVGVVCGLRLDGAVGSDVAARLEDGLAHYPVLVFRDAPLDDTQLTAFAASFGALENFAFAYGSGAGSQVSVARISNVDGQGRIRAAEDPARVSVAADAMWHTDGSYRAVPVSYSMLSARVLPPSGGQTEFCDTRAAYEALPLATKKKLEGLIGLHSIIYSRTLVGYTGWSEAQRAALPAVPQPLVLANARSGRRALYIASHICEIAGWPTEEARAFVGELIAFATQSDYVYAHTWQVGDLVIWDNRATMHRRAPYDDLNAPRDLRALRVLDLARAATA